MTATRVETTNTGAQSAAPTTSERPIEEGFRIEPYRPEDRPAVEEICARTGLRGRREEFFCDRELFVKFWLSPYLDSQPEYCRVVRDRENRVVGYLVGTIGPGYKARVLKTNLPHVTRLIVRWMSGRYRHHPPTGRFIRWLLLRSWQENPAVPPEMTAHFHFNLLPEARKGVGWNLVFVFEDLVRQAGYKGWHAVVFSSMDKRDARIYQRLGFTLGEKKRCTLFPEEVYFLVIMHAIDGKPLDITRLGRITGMKDEE